jgi:4-diphosphocytidyl-2-C-methyl-D-erythritol kinase
MSGLERVSPCKVNLLLNILGKRPDGYHEVETILQPVALHDTLRFERIAAKGVELTCSHPGLPTDSSNLVRRAAEQFLEKAGIEEGVRIYLEKRIPLAAGLGGGSGNAAVTLLALNELFGQPLGADVIQGLAAGLGSDVPFFLQPSPALGTGRGEKVTSLEPFAALRGAFVLLIHPGFGVSTAWAYQALANFPEALHGQAGRAGKLISLLQKGRLADIGQGLYNSLEAPVLHKYPVLALYQEFAREQGAAAALMSGSGSTTFALCQTEKVARALAGALQERFGADCWTAVAPL